MLFVSQIDELHATGQQTNANMCIPVSPDILSYAARLRSTKRRRRIGKPRILVSLPVTNAAQNRIDKELVEHLLRITSDRAAVTIWGKGAKAVSESLNCRDTVHVSEWVEDYPSFIASFDLMVYPRLVGSGFHGKLAEALVLGVPCLCADWVGKPLKACGYDGLYTFTGGRDFETAYTDLFEQILSSQGLPLPIVPTQAQKGVAIAPLIEACRDALKTPLPTK
jgi:glycosyltransferase involved in cell wall biosynthesis